MNPNRTNPFEAGVDRRRVLRESAAIGATSVTAGCLGADDDPDRAPTVYVFNSGDRTLSVIDAEDDELVENAFIDTTASFPANQYGTGADSEYDVLWLNVSGGVRALDGMTLEEVAAVETGFGPNYPNLTPDEQHLLVASGGTTSMDPDPDEPEDHAIFRIGADPESGEFGEVTGEIETDYVGPCDVTLDADGKYTYVPEIANETLRVVRTDPFETVAEIDVGEPASEGDVLPFMATASFDGDVLLVENAEGELGSDPDVPRRGSESIWDITDPEEPEELAKITREDGLPAMPITSEVGVEGEFGYLFTPGAESVTVLDIEQRSIADELDVGGESIGGAWGPHREKLYVPVQTANHVAVIDHTDREVAATVEAGELPTGAVGGMVRPEIDAEQRLQSRLAHLGLAIGDREPTYCPENTCYCG